MTEYLTKEQRAELERQLSGGLTEEEAQQALYEGARMAQRELGVSQQPGGDMLALDEEDRAFLKKYGFESMADVRRSFRTLQDVVEMQRGLLSDLREIERADATAAALDARHPGYAAGRVFEMEMRPVRDKALKAARNRMIQQEWMLSAAGLRDLERLLPEIAEYIMAEPRLAEDSEGLVRAYEAVRSRKYRDTDELLADPEFIRKMAENEAIREAVLRAHMEEIQKGGGVPQMIGAGSEAGKTPVTGRKPITGMEMAKKRLEAMLR
jgi:hypothetical protein